jgi:hypothetical protein
MYIYIIYELNLSSYNDLLTIEYTTGTILMEEETFSGQLHREYNT